MNPTRKILFALALVGLAAASALGAATTSTTVRLAKHPEIVITSNATATSLLGKATAPTSMKHALVHRFTVNGQEVDVLVRLEEARGIFWVDLVADATVTSLSTRVASLDVSATATGHPSPTKDAVDTSAMVAAGGS